MAFNRVEEVQDLVPLRRALVSVYDKDGLPRLIRGLALAAPGLEIYSTGGSYAAVAEVLASLDPAPGQAPEPRLVAVSEYTGQPEMEGGLVKTLDWKIYLGLLAEAGNAAHAADLERTGAVAFDLVVGDLYPFEAACRDPSSEPEALRQRIDIGGPAMLRAAAKNYLRVASVSSPGQYAGLLEELRVRGGHTSLDYRRRLAAAAFDRVSRFDRAVSSRLGAMTAEELKAGYRGL